MSKDADGGAVDMSQLLLDELLGSFTNWANISNGERANTSMPALAGWVLTDMRLSALDLEVRECCCVMPW